MGLNVFEEYGDVVEPAWCSERQIMVNQRLVSGAAVRDPSGSVAVCSCEK